MAFLDENGLTEVWGRICTKHDGFVNEHVWEKYAEGQVPYAKESSTTTRITIDTAVTGYYVQSSRSIGIENNKVVLIAPTSVEINSMAGTYIQHSDGAIYRVVRTVSGEGTKSVWEVYAQSVAYASGVVGYVSSPNSNAYPPEVDDGFTYKHMGQMGSKSGVIVGRYTGNGSTQTIKLSMTPKAVFVMMNGYMLDSNSSNFYGGLAITDAPATTGSIVFMKIVDGGFQVIQNDGNRLYINSSGAKYSYVAWY